MCKCLMGDKTTTINSATSKRTVLRRFPVLIDRAKIISRREAESIAYCTCVVPKVSFSRDDIYPIHHTTSCESEATAVAIAVSIGIAYVYGVAATPTLVSEGHDRSVILEVSVNEHLGQRGMITVSHDGLEPLNHHIVCSCNFGISGTLALPLNTYPHHIQTT